jgi:hypothetical protein
MGTACGYHTAPVTDAMQRIPPIIGGDKQSKIGGGVIRTRRPRRLLLLQKKKTPRHWGVKRNKIGAVISITPPHRRP